MTAIEIVASLLGTPTFTPEGIILYAIAGLFVIVTFNTVCDIIRMVGSSIQKWT